MPDQQYDYFPGFKPPPGTEPLSKKKQQPATPNAPLSPFSPAPTQPPKMMQAAPSVLGNAAKQYVPPIPATQAAPTVQQLAGPAAGTPSPFQQMEQTIRNWQPPVGEQPKADLASSMMLGPTGGFGNLGTLAKMAAEQGPATVPVTSSEARKYQMSGTYFDKAGRPYPAQVQKWEPAGTPHFAENPLYKEDQPMLPRGTRPGWQEDGSWNMRIGGDTSPTAQRNYPFSPQANYNAAPINFLDNYARQNNLNDALRKQLFAEDTGAKMSTTPERYEIMAAGGVPSWLKTVDLTIPATQETLRKFGQSYINPRTGQTENTYDQTIQDAMRMNASKFRPEMARIGYISQRMENNPTITFEQAVKEANELMGRQEVANILTKPPLSQDVLKSVLSGEVKQDVMQPLDFGKLMQRITTEPGLRQDAQQLADEIIKGRYDDSGLSDFIATYKPPSTWLPAYKSPNKLNELPADRRQAEFEANRQFLMDLMWEIQKAKQQGENRKSDGVLPRY